MRNLAVKLEILEQFKVDNFEFIVKDTYKIKGNIFGHAGYVQAGKLNLKDKGNAIINISHRSNIKRNHSATHLFIKH